MKLEKVNHLVQITAGIVLIVGVVLVVIQIQQTEKLSSLEALTSYFDMNVAQAISAAGENPMQAYAKLCSEEDLTFEEALVLHNLFISRHMMALQAELRAKMSGSRDDSWRRVAHSNLPLIIATEQGRAWWGARPQSVEMREVAESSRYYTSNCDDLGVEVAALIRADKEIKVRRRNRATKER